MKTTLKALILLALTTSCATTMEQWQTQYLESNIDFSKYAADDFLITPFEYNGKYESVGFIQIIARPKIDLVSHTTRPNVEFGEKVIYDGGNYYVARAVSLENAIEKAYQEAKEMGANAIVNLKIESIELNNGIHKLDGLKITGFAIKR
ncbi:MAG: hypothetical protein ACPGLV_15520 [Bacteroidia bacterium]